MAKIQIMLLMVVVMITSPVVARVVADNMPPADAMEVTDESHSNSPSAHGHGGEDTDCCHSICVCCTAQGSLLESVQANSWKRPGSTPMYEPDYLPNPHLDVLLRPPKYS